MAGNLAPGNGPPRKRGLIGEDSDDADDDDWQPRIKRVPRDGDLALDERDMASYGARAKTRRSQARFARGEGRGSEKDKKPVEISNHGYSADARFRNENLSSQNTASKPPALPMEKASIKERIQESQAWKHYPVVLFRKRQLHTQTALDKGTYRDSPDRSLSQNQHLSDKIEKTSRPRSPQAQKVEVPSSQGNEPTSSAPTKPKTIIDIKYEVVIMAAANEDMEYYDTWRPSTMLKKISLANLMEDLPTKGRRVSYIDIQFRTPAGIAKGGDRGIIMSGEEDIWKTVLGTLDRRISESIPKSKKQMDEGRVKIKAEVKVWCEEDQTNSDNLMEDFDY